YFVMEYADRGNLLDRLNGLRSTKQFLTLAEVLDFARELSACLQAAHEFGIVHRDLKPSNILFRTAPSHQTVTAPIGAREAHENMVLADFGIARRIEGATTHTISAGTPHYMAPEQADPQRAGRGNHRSRSEEHTSELQSPD